MICWSLLAVHLHAKWRSKYWKHITNLMFFFVLFFSKKFCWLQIGRWIYIHKYICVSSHWSLIVNNKQTVSKKSKAETHSSENVRHYIWWLEAPTKEPLFFLHEAKKSKGVKIFIPFISTYHSRYNMSFRIYW